MNSIQSLFARIRVQSLIFVFLGCGFVANAFADEIPFEYVERQFQARYEFFLGTPLHWPSGAPDHPDNGYYGGNTNSAVMDAQALAGNMASLMGRFVARKDGDITGLSTIPYYTASSPEMKPVTVTAGNFVGSVRILADQLAKLNYVTVGASPISLESKSGTAQGTFTCQGWPDCAQTVGAAVAAFNAAQWGQSYINYYPSPYNNSIGCVSGSQGMGPSGNIGYSASSYTAFFTGPVSGAGATRGKIQADLTGFTNGGSAQLYLKIATSGSGKFLTGNSPNNGFVPYGSMAVGKISKSGEIEPPMGGIPGDCSTSGGAGAPTISWSVGDQVVVVKPNFKEKVDQCDQCAGNTFCSANSPQLHSLDYTINLGRDSFTSSAGQLQIWAETPSAQLATPMGLQGPTVGPNVKFIYADNISSLYGTNSVIRQVLSTQALADIVPQDDFHYQINLYTSDQVGSTNAFGIYQVSGQPFRTVTIQNPDGASAFNRLNISNTEQGHTINSQYSWTGGAGVPNVWTLITGNGLRTQALSASWSTNNVDLTEISTVTNPDKSVASNEVRQYHLFPWGKEMVSKTVDPKGPHPQTTTRNFYTDAADTNNYSRLQQVIQPTGYWEKYQYDIYGRETKRVAQYLDAPVGSPDSQCRVITTTYSDTAPQITTVQTLLGQEISRSYTLESPGDTQQIQSQTPGATYTDPNNLVTDTKTWLSGALPGATQSIKYPSGSMSFYSYSTNATTQTTTILTGAPDSGGTTVVDGTRTVSVANLSGTTISEVKSDILSGLTLTTMNAASDNLGRPTHIDYHDGTSLDNTYDCCGLASTKDHEGITTTFLHDDLQRVIASTRAGITTLNSLDAEGRVLSSARVGSDNSQITVNTSTYDLLGRVTSSTDALNRKTALSEFLDGSGHTVRTTTFPDGATRIETYYQDGSLLSITGTHEHPIKYLYGVDANGEFTQEIRVGDRGAITEWTKTYRDMVGRPYKVVQADGATTLSYFNSKGQLIRQVDPDGVATLYAYNAKGELQYTALDMNQDGLINFTGTDRISQTVNDVVTDHGVPVTRSTTSVWTANGDGASTSVVSVNETSADSLQNWNTAYGITTHTQTVYDGAGGRTVTVTNPEGSYTVSQYLNDRLVSVTQKDSTGLQLAAYSYLYDPHGRQVTVTDARTGATTFAYDNGDQLISTTTPAPGGIGSAETTSTLFDNMGRPMQTTLPDGGVVNNQYFGTGELQQTSGARTYTTSYTYDPQGRIKTEQSGSGLTTWNYSPTRGFLTSKIYADGTGPSYTYTQAGRPMTRLWARGITTVYGYDTAGEVNGISYSDSTPSVAYSFDRRGRRISSSGSVEVLGLIYNDAGEPLVETHTGGPLNGITVSSGYDALLRRSSLSAANFSFSMLNSQFSYDGASRLASVGDGTHSANYSYLPNSSLVNTLAFRAGSASVMTTTKTWDNLNRLASISSVSSVAGSSYQYNSANQRIKDTLADNSYWNFNYDNLGQVISGHKYFSDSTAVLGQQFTYSFDNIGNRTSSTVNARSSTYTANPLNQYLQRTVPGAVDLFGTADPTATVTVNSQPTTRNGAYFYKELSLQNSAGAMFQSFDVEGVKTGAGPGGANVVVDLPGNIFVPQTPETFSYDADGNLAQNGRWTHSWDAENRLTTVTAITSIPDGAKKKVDYVYDYQWRMIQRKISVWNGTAYVLSTTTNFVWDGWRLTAELDGNGNLLRSYQWGQDLSGSMNGAGGVGGLLAVRDVASNATYLVCHDGNGNVMAFVNADTGQIAGENAFGPFGERLRATGIAKSIPIGWSSKYTDPITGYVYYGYRWYDPSTGRFLSRDPIGEVGGDNLYGFVGNDPIDRIDPFGLADDASPWLLGWEWLTGTGPEIHHFVNGDNFTELLKKHQHIENLRKKLRDQLADHCSKCNTSKLDGRDPYTLRGLQGVPKYLGDYSTLLTGGATGNLAVTFLGSYDLSYDSKQISCKKGTAEIHFNVYNASTIESATHPPVVGYTPWWSNWIGRPLNDFFSSGPLSKKEQVIDWTENLDFKGNPCCTQ